MNKADILLGLQWGDEGKGKIVDVLTPDYDVVARFQGGPNAGHTLKFGGKKHVLHTIPSGIFRENCINIIGNGVVIDPVIFKKEIDALEKFGFDIRKRLFISRKAHLILPTHQLLDAASEEAKGKGKIGSTLKGIGPAYMDKTGRNGLRIGDTTGAGFLGKYKTLKDKHETILIPYVQTGFTYDLAEKENAWFEGIELLKSFTHIDSEIVINQYLTDGKKILAEGAQGTLLDIDFGDYPFVTSSVTTAAGACIGLGIAPNRTGEVVGIFKAYCTRVGNGPFPSELENEVGEALRKYGEEYGSTTGRPRRCGWLDLPLLKYAIMLSGVTKLVMMKTDVLPKAVNELGLEKFKVLMKHDKKGNHEYKDFEIWEDCESLNDDKEIPRNLFNFIQFIEIETGVPITYVSTGPGRKEIVKTMAHV